MYVMGKSKPAAIDGLFGSKTRVKLMHLFLSNPGKSFYVREITRLIDEQINSVRRELSNMLAVGVIDSDTADNKLYYSVNQRYEHYHAFKEIFTGKKTSRSVKNGETNTQQDSSALYQMLSAVPNLRLAIVAGVLVEGSASEVDLLLVGMLTPQKIKTITSRIEKSEGRSLNYTVLNYDEFYYRLSIRDKFLMQVLSSKHDVIIDNDKILTAENQK